MEIDLKSMERERFISTIHTEIKSDELLVMRDSGTKFFGNQFSSFWDETWRLNIRLCTLCGKCVIVAKCVIEAKCNGILTQRESYLTSLSVAKNIDEQ